LFLQRWTLLKESEVSNTAVAFLAQIMMLPFHKTVLNMPNSSEAKLVHICSYTPLKERPIEAEAKKDRRAFFEVA
jgi:hypothetical protein